MQDETLELLISIAHYARDHRRFNEARYLFGRLALLYPKQAFPYLGSGLVELDCANYRNASLLFGRALEAVPDSALARAWLGVCQILEGHYALGARMLMTVDDSDQPGATSMAAAFLTLPQCAPFATARVVQGAPTAASFPTIERLSNRNGY